jgi:hypothetical protein
MTMQVRHWRMLAWLATTAVAACAGVMLWNIVKNFKGGTYVAQSTTHFSDMIAKSPGTIPSSDIRVAEWKEYDKLVHCPINGIETVKPVADTSTPAPPPPPSKKKIEDVLILQVVTFAPEDLGRVVVKYKDDSLSPPPLKDQIVLGVGAKLAAPYDIEPFNATLKSIKPNTAIFDWCGEVVELHPTKREEVKSDKAATAGAGDKKGTLSDEDKKALAQVSDKTLNLGNERYLVGTTDQKNIKDNGDKFLGEMRIAERPGANKKPEVVLSNVRSNSYVARTYGLQNEDVLVSINGTPVSSKSQGYQYVRDNPDLSRYDVVIRRAGREITKTVLVNRDKK